MKDISNSNFGLLIAYALPGFVALWGISGIWPTAAGCLSSTGTCTPSTSLVGFFNSTIAAIAAGMALGAVRFVIVDSLHALTGLRRPQWNGQAFGANLEAVKTLVDQHYRFYQFYSGMLIAGIVAYGAHLYKQPPTFDVPVLMLALLIVVFWIASRDSLKKYYNGLATIFITETHGDHIMTNGMSSEHKDPKQTKAGAKQEPTTAPQGKASKPSGAIEEDAPSNKQ